MDNDKKPQEGTNPEELELEINLDPIDGTEDAEALKTKFEEAQKKLEQFNNVVARAKKAEEEAKALKAKLTETAPRITKPEPKDDNELASKVSRLEEIENKRQFGYEHNLSPEETDVVFQFSGGKPTKETMEHPFVQAGIEALRANKRVENNTPRPSLKGMTFNNKPFAELKPDEKQKVFEERVKGAKK